MMDMPDSGEIERELIKNDSQ